ncbi:MAG: hypothetical protein IJ222_00155 [Bacteroidales bacterium]|nr:hypothetical protein [Bacteroidales bacterium]
MSKQRAIIIFLLCSLAFTARAQDLPQFPKSSRIVTGSFPNGVAYYLVANNTSKGYATFALAQKGAYGQEVSREALKGPLRFLSSNGIGYGPEGYVAFPGEAAVYTFKDVPTFDSAVCDSALVMLNRLTEEFYGEQAVVICGDINTDKIKDKLQMLSLTVARRGPSPEGEEYEWIPSYYPGVIHYGNRSSGLAEISISFTSPRTRREHMNTPQPLVSQLYARQLGYIIRKRTEAAFAAAGLALGYARFGYVDSSRTPGDERYSFTIGVSDSCTEQATAILSSLLSELDSEGALEEEFLDAKNRFHAYAAKAFVSSSDNGELVGQCVANYLYGSNLADNETLAKFFYGRKMDTERDLALFNRFVSALLDPVRNLTLSYSTPADSLDAGAMLDSFRDSWVPRSGEAVSYTLKAADTLSLYYPVDRKLKLKSESVEPLTGGKLWTFSNGMNVVFRKSSDYQLRYALMIRGGCAEVPGILEGESAFVGDMLSLYDVAGLSQEHFSDMLGANGVSMDCKVSLSDMRISGTAPSNKLSLVMRSLLSIQKDRRFNDSAYSYYKRCEAIRQEAFRLTTDGINAITDSIMCPDFFYPSTKSMDKLSDGLPGKAEQYFQAQFRKNNDGILYIEGNYDEQTLLKYLCRTLGSFATSQAVSLRPKVPFQLCSGFATYAIDRKSHIAGDGTCSTNLALSAVRPFTMKDWCAFRISVEALRRILVEELAPMGQTIEIVPRLYLLPVERVAVFVNCHPCSATGLPAGVKAEDPINVAGALRTALERLRDAKITPTRLAGYKASLSNEMASEKSDPAFLMEACLRRYSEGKDMISHYATFLDKVTVEDVAAVLRDLEEGSKVEYVIK